MQNIWIGVRYFLTRVSSKYRASLKHKTWNSRFSDGGNTTGNCGDITGNNGDTTTRNGGEMTAWMNA